MGRRRRWYWGQSNLQVMVKDRMAETMRLEVFRHRLEHMRLLQEFEHLKYRELVRRRYRRGTAIRDV